MRRSAITAAAVAAGLAWRGWGATPALAAEKVPAQVPAEATRAQVSTELVDKLTTSGSWMLVVGVVFVVVALMAMLVPAIVLWTPRSRVLRGGLRESAGRGVRSVTDRAGGWANSVLPQRSGGAALDRLLDEAGLDVRAGEFVVAVLGAALGAFAVSWVLASFVFGLIVGLLVLVAARLLLGHLGSRRRLKFVAQLPDTLRMIAGSLRAGYGLTQAIDVVERECESPTSDEFRRLTVEMRLGRNFNDALRALADRMRSRDFDWVVQAFEIHHEIGGDLAEVLDSVNETIRDRERIRRKVRALSAEGRLSAVVLFALPFVFGAISFFFNPGYLHELTSTRSGLLMLATGLTLMACGGLWLRRLVKLTY